VIDEELTQAIRDYLQWMVSEGYAPSTCESYRCELNHFLSFVNDKDIRWDDIFHLDTLQSFQKNRAVDTVMPSEDSRGIFLGKKESDVLLKKHSTGCPKSMNNIYYIMNKDGKFLFDGLSKPDKSLLSLIIICKGIASIFHH